MSRWTVALCWALAALAGPLHAQDYTKPKIRAVTGFVRLDREHFDQEIEASLQVLRSAQAEFTQQGYAVETLRVVSQPLAELVSGLSEQDALALLKHFDELSQKEHFTPNVGPAMMRDTDDPRTMRLLARALTTLPHLNASAIIAGEDGIHWKVIHETAVLVRYVADHSTSAESSGNQQFTASAMLAPYGPFYPAAYHVGAGKAFSVGFEGANVVLETFAHTPGNFAAAVSGLTRQLAIHAKVAEAVGQHIAAASGWSYMGVDPTPAPSDDHSIGTAMERFSGSPFGSSGTMTAALAITTAVKAVPVKQVGYSGLMLPVMEDTELSKRWGEGAMGIDQLLAYSAVCGTGLDTIPLPGNVSVEQLTRIYGDVASLAWKWHKPLSARLLPMKGVAAGEKTRVRDLINTTLQPLS